MEHTLGSILIADGDSSNIAMLDRILFSDYVILTAKSGEECLTRAAEDRPDIILLDIKTAGDDFDILQRLKSSSETEEIPVIVVADSDKDEYEERGFALGAVDFIVRPFRDSAVKARVKNYIRIIRQFRALERLGMVDALTCIPNRRRFDDSFATEWKRAMRDKVYLSFMMMDLDYFKEYNDTYGHPQGDALLQSLAKLLESFARRPGDLIARLGGEEFGLLLPAASPEAAASTAENIRSAVEAMRVPAAGGKTITRITISIGLMSIIPRPENKPEEFIARADAFLYIAKNEGRNRVCSGTT